MTLRLGTAATVWDVWVWGGGDPGEWQEVVGEVRFAVVEGRMRYVAVLFADWVITRDDRPLGDYADKRGAVQAIREAYEQRQANR